MPTKRWRWLGSTIALLLSVLVSKPAAAWKVDAHIWIANEVLQDARDGRIEIDFGGTSRSITLNARYARAISSNPQAFLLGSLGPDAFPDVVAGQMVIHPSVLGGWGTAEWLEHLMARPDLSDAELSFTLGYLTHASADIFAHTFVNRYAGDIFDLSEHRSAALRHIYIESFISSFLPPLTRGRGPVWRDAATAVRTDGVIAFPEAFIRERLLFNPAVIEQYRRSGAAGHLVSAYDLHNDLGALLAEGGFFDALEADILDLVAELYLQIPIDDRIARDLQDLKRDVDGWLNNKAGEAAIALQKINDEFSKIGGAQIELAQNAFAEATRLTADVSRVAIDIATLDGEIAAEIEKRDRMITLGQGPYEVEVSVAECLLFGPLGCITSGLVKKIEKRIPSPYQAVLDVIAEKNRLLGQAKKEINDYERRAQEAIKSGFDLVKTAHDLHRQATNRFIAFVLDKPFGSPFRNHFERWYEAIPVALIEFTRANGSAIVNSIDPATPSVTEPLREWLLCHGPVFVSVPTRIVGNICFALDGFEEIKGKIDALEKDLAEMVPVVRDVYRLKEKIEEDLTKLRSRLFDQATMEGLREFDRHAGTPTLELYKALTQSVGVTEVNAIMAVDASGQNLPLIPDAGERILLEMHVKDGRLDPKRFNALYNGIVLSKLVLLDQQGLQSLARLGGVRDSVFGPGLFGGDDSGSQNILFGFIRSIDGNHQSDYP